MHNLQSISEKPTYKDKKIGKIDFTKMSEFRDCFLKSGFCVPKSYDFTASILIDPSIQNLISQVFFLISLLYTGFCIYVYFKKLNPLSFEELNSISISREPVRMAQAVLEMEIVERDIEINQLKQQLAKMEAEKSNIIEELNLDKNTFRTDESISSVTPAQLRELLTLLAAERLQNRRRTGIPQIDTKKNKLT